jgi:hypothetical protein
MNKRSTFTVTSMIRHWDTGGELLNYLFEAVAIFATLYIIEI